uniref:Uncharacterized protein n=1 Tax=Arundo donax TaxID=35708 RepID=A0A0A8XRX3_ARUDO
MISSCKIELLALLIEESMLLTLPSSW